MLVHALRPDVQVAFRSGADRLEEMAEHLGRDIADLLTFELRVPFEINTTALVEGVTPAPNMLQYEDVSVVISQYGAWVNFTDVNICVLAA